MSEFLGFGTPLIVQDGDLREALLQLNATVQKRINDPRATVEIDPSTRQIFLL